MNKDEFFIQLKKELRATKESDRKDIIEDYQEHFEEAKKKGKSEEEICKELGNPRDIAKELHAYAVIEKAEGNLSISNIFKVIATFLSLGIFNLVFILPYLGAVMVLVGIAFVSIAFVVGGIGGFATLIIGITVNVASITSRIPLMFLYSLLAMGGGALLGVLDYFAILSFYKFTIKYIKMNVNLVKDKD